MEGLLDRKEERFLKVATEAVTAAADGLREDNERAEYRRASLHGADVRADLRADDQLVIAYRHCPTSRAYFRGIGAIVTWAPDRQSFVCEHGIEEIARWAGFRAFEYEDDEHEVGVIWYGTRKTASGTYAAQFEVVVEA